MENDFQGGRYEIAVPMSYEQYKMFSDVAKLEGRTIPVWMRESLVRVATRKLRRIKSIKDRLEADTYVTPDKIAKTAERIIEDISNDVGLREFKKFAEEIEIV